MFGENVNWYRGGFSEEYYASLAVRSDFCATSGELK